MPPNLEFYRAKAKRWRAENPLAARRIAVRTYLKCSYGLTVEQFDAMFARQHARCAICGINLISPTDESREVKGHAPNEVARVDHDHQTGHIRGLLCFGCNVGLGKFRDDNQLLLKAVGYLRASATQQAQPVAERESVSEIEPGNRDLESSVRRGSRREQLSPF